MKNLPKTEAEASRQEETGGNQTSESADFAVVLFMWAADSHEATRALFPNSRVLRARTESREQAAAVCRRSSAQVFRLQGRASDGLSCGRWIAASRESRPADDNGKNRFWGCLASKPGYRFLPIEIPSPDQAKDPIGIRRMRRNALGAGLGARTLTENATEFGCVYREKRLTVERAAA
ncbi:MAG TPA: hypothetical protein VNJ52_06525 [Patescibacteria group bacterium]|nr:hypothetical protein [Patescibacteria group bacterium]